MSRRDCGPNRLNSRQWWLNRNHPMLFRNRQLDSMWEFRYSFPRHQFGSAADIMEAIHLKHHALIRTVATSATDTSTVPKDITVATPAIMEDTVDSSFLTKSKPTPRQLIAVSRG